MRRSAYSLRKISNNTWVCEAGMAEYTRDLVNAEVMHLIWRTFYATFCGKR